MKKPTTKDKIMTDMVNAMNRGEMQVVRPLQDQLDRKFERKRAESKEKKKRKRAV